MTLFPTAIDPLSDGTSNRGIQVALHGKPGPARLLLLPYDDDLMAGSLLIVVSLCAAELVVNANTGPFSTKRAAHRPSQLRDAHRVVNY